MPMTAVGPFTCYSENTKNWQVVENLEFDAGNLEKKYVLHDRRIYCYLLTTQDNGQPQLIRGYYDPNYTALSAGPSEETQTHSNQPREKGRWFWTRFRPNFQGTDGNFTTPLRPSEIIKLGKAVPLEAYRHEMEAITLPAAPQETDTQSLERGPLNMLHAATIDVNVKMALLRPDSRSIREHAQILQAAITGDFTAMTTRESLYGPALMIHSQLLPRTLMAYGRYDAFRLTQPPFVRVGDIWRYVRALITQEIVVTNLMLAKETSAEPFTISLGPLESPQFPTAIYSLRVGIEHDLILYHLIPYNGYHIEVGLFNASQTVFLWLVGLVSSQSWFINFPTVSSRIFCRFPFVQELLTPREITLVRQTISDYFARAESPLVREFDKFIRSIFLNEMKVLPEDLLRTALAVEDLSTRFFRELRDHFNDAEQAKAQIVGQLTNRSALGTHRETLNADLVLRSWRILSKATLLRLARYFPETMQDNQVLAQVLANYSIPFNESYLLNILSAIVESYRLTRQRIKPCTTIRAIVENKTGDRFKHDFTNTVHHAILMAPDCFDIELLWSVLAKKHDSEFETTLPIAEIFRIIIKPFFKMVYFSSAASELIFDGLVNYGPKPLLILLLDAIKAEDFRNITNPKKFLLLMALKITIICKQDLDNPEISIHSVVRLLHANPESSAQRDTFVRQVFSNLSCEKIAAIFQPITKENVLIAMLFPEDIKVRCFPDTAALGQMTSLINSPVRASVNHSASTSASSQRVTTARNLTTSNFGFGAI